jgi:hypothetical protein
LFATLPCPEDVIAIRAVRARQMAQPLDDAQRAVGVDVDHAALDDQTVVVRRSDRSGLEQRHGALARDGQGGSIAADLSEVGGPATGRTGRRSGR